MIGAFFNVTMTSTVSQWHNDKQCKPSAFLSNSCSAQVIHLNHVEDKMLNFERIADHTRVHYQLSRLYLGAFEFKLSEANKAGIVVSSEIVGH